MWRAARDKILTVGPDSVDSHRQPRSIIVIREIFIKRAPSVIARMLGGTKEALVNLGWKGEKHGGGIDARLLIQDRQQNEWEWKENN